MTRNEVEEYLKQTRVEFGHMCCIDERSAYADLIKIGSEKAPWFCTAHTVNIALEFAAVKSHELTSLDDSDVLKRITLYHSFDGCL